MQHITLEVIVVMVVISAVGIHLPKILSLIGRKSKDKNEEKVNR